MEEEKDSSVVELYESASEEKRKNFSENIESNLHVQTDYEKVIKDTDWITIIEDTIPYIDNIFRNPNRFIINEEEIVKIELARKITVESIKHLSKNTNLIQDINKKTGDVRPSKILNINKQESYDTYENRLIYTLVQNIKFFVGQKKKTLEQFQNVGNKNNKQINYSGTSKVKDERVNINVLLNTYLDSETEGKEKQENPDDILSRIEKLEVKISDVCSSDVYKVIDKKHISLVREPIKKTNVVLKNVNFQYAMKLWTYLRDNMDDKTQNINEKQDYDDTGKLKQLMDDSFFLDYLILNTIDKEKQEEVPSEVKKEEVQNIVISKMLEKAMDVNDDLTEKELKDMVSQAYAIIKYRNMVTMQELQNIFTKHIDKYLQKIKK